MVGKVNGKSPQPAPAAETTEVNHISEKQTKTPSELHKGGSESSPIKASASQISSQKAEQSLGGLARQAGLFNYVLPQNSTNLMDISPMPKLPDLPTTPGGTTMAVGEEDGDKPKLPKLPDPTTPSGVTTMAVGEEDGGFNPNPKPGGGSITYAVGEEDGSAKLPKSLDPPTTPGGFTTMAVGEEDGGDKPKLPKLPELPTTPGGFTTMAVGEEDGGPQPQLPNLPEPTTPGEITTMAVGEEDGTTGGV